MSVDHPFTVEGVEDLQLDGPDELGRSDLMSPYVWRLETGRQAVLVRVVPAPGREGPNTGRLWYGESEDGLRFAMDPAPVLEPGPGPDDARGCEDPTVVPVEGGLVVYYTGVSDAGEGRLLWARGPHVHALEKQGLAAASLTRGHDVKEAEVSRRGDHWTLGYEYALDGASSIGLAEGEGPAGPWRETRHTFAARPGGWDSWHLSPGPLLFDDPERPVMFYNGGTRDARWGIGWVAFDHRRNAVRARCDAPLIPPPSDGRAADGGDRDISFAASLVEEDGLIRLYLSRNDRTLHRATLRRRSDLEDLAS